MGKQQTTRAHGTSSAPERPAQSNGGHRLELGRREINLEALCKFGQIELPGVGTISLAYSMFNRGQVSCHFEPSVELTTFIKQENERIRHGEERSPRKRI